MQQKATLRNHYRDKLKEFCVTQHDHNQIIANLKRLDIWPGFKVVGGFRSLKDEPCLDEFYKQEGLDFVFPELQADNTITFQGKSLDVCLVPGRAFDRQGYRLGRGLACYDKYLKDKKIFKIGIAWSMQLEADLPVEPHDIRMDAIVTEKFSLILKHKEGQL